jgi:hypothetical protein
MSSYTFELYRNEKGVAWQCDLTNTIAIEFGDMEVRFRVHDFAVFRRKVNSIDIKAMLFDLSDACDDCLIEAPKNQLSHRLTLCELIQLRDLLNGAKFALDLGSMLHEALGDVQVIA